ncbi:hypothetical protein PENSPDRAFT_720786, partial [Peniophora sp. CONT]
MAPSGRFDAQDRFWALYLKNADSKDTERSQRWKGDTEGILVFTGLFASTVATFVVVSYPLLTPGGGGDETIILLRQLVTLTNGGEPLDLAGLRIIETMSPSTSALFINALWFLSLIVSISCALLAVMVQQWTRQYAQDTRRGEIPSKRGPVHSQLSLGIDRFMMENAIELITSLVHVAVALFFAGLTVFLSTLNAVIASLAATAIALIAISYTVLSVLPLRYPDCPYRTPLTDFL